MYVKQLLRSPTEVKPPNDVLRQEMRPEHFHCLLHILTANALDWLTQADDRRIRLAVSATGDRCRILFSDSGPGIPAGIVTRVFEPGFSMKECGRGMGLTLARRLLEMHGGEILVLLDGRRTGANLQLELPRKRSRATVYEGH